MNEIYIQKLINLINAGMITLENIKDPVYKAEVQTRISAQ